MADTQLFLFPHQDDEFGVFPLLDQPATRAVCVYLTDGVAGRATAAQRNAESLGVLRRCGISDDRIRFPGTELGVRDGTLVDALDRMFDATLSLAMTRQVTAIHVPAWEGGHPDHDAAVLLGRALAAALRLEGALWQFPLYNAWRTSLVPFRVLHALPENGPRRTLPVAGSARREHLRRCLMYPSQWKTWAAIWPFVALRYLSAPGQTLQPVIDARLSERPHAGALLYERRKWTTWDEQMSRSLAFRRRHGLI
jgi:LmbE family N-acetylglucosaminyl deacetylase